MSDLLNQHAEVFSWIDAMDKLMLAKTIEWCNQNSGSTNIEGLSAFAKMLENDFSLLCDVEKVDLGERVVLNDHGVEETISSPPILRMHMPKENKPSILLVAHYDTVYGVDHPFQKCSMNEDGHLNGPGAADLKGGIMVMLFALQALKMSGLLNEIGVEILLNPDEEIGSPSSGDYLSERAKHNDVGLIFEPSLPDGTLVGSRKGSGNFHIRVKGKSAHAGREIENGRNALVKLMQILLEVDQLHDAKDGLTVNVAQMNAGRTTNMVPEMAVGRFNARLSSIDDATWFEAQVDAIIEKHQAEGYEISKFGGITRHPKAVTPANQNLQDFVKETGSLFGLDVNYKHTGGVCDGNNLAKSGLPNIDTLGVRGGNIHSSDEYMVIESLSERAKFVALIMMRMANGEFKFLKDD